jgi:hypothetical protein
MEFFNAEGQSESLFSQKGQPSSKMKAVIKAAAVTPLTG